LLAALTPAAAEHAGGPEQAGPRKEARVGNGAELTAAVYDHLLYLRHESVDGAYKSTKLVLLRIGRDRFARREVLDQPGLADGWKPLAAVNAKLYAVSGGALLCIDLLTGKAEEIYRYLRPFVCRDGRLYAVVWGAGDEEVLRVFDFSTRAQHDVCPVGSGLGLPPGPMAVSPDGARLAFFRGELGETPGEADQPQIVDPETAHANRLHVVDLEQEKVKVVGESVQARTFGGLRHRPGPPFAWIDNRTILLAYDVPPLDGHGNLNFFGGGWKSVLAAMDVVTGKRTDVLKLPEWRRREGEACSVDCEQGEDPRIVLGQLSQYRVDLKRKRLIEDDRIGGDFHWARGRPPERLLLGNRELFGAEWIPAVSVSPCGKRIAWITKPGTEAQIRYSDQSDERVRVIAEGWFPRGWTDYGRDRSGPFMWLTEADLRATQPPGPPPGWTRFVTGPYPRPPDPPPARKRLDIAQFLTMTLSTDRPKYRLHEPVKLTVALAAKAEKDVTLPRPNGYSSRFNLAIRGPRTFRMIDAFERLPEIFASDQAVIKAGENSRCTRIIEPDAAGVFKVSGAFSAAHTDWKGRTEAEPISFVVEKSAQDARLLKEKFDRLMALCRKEYAVDPMTCRYSRICRLKDGAVPLLVAEIRASEDPGFRKRMGYALAAMANADALPYFRSLLAGEMKHDQQMVLDGLLTMVRRSRSRNEALELLLKALKHPNTQLRREAAKRLARVHDPHVKQGFGAAVSDEDATTATAAARYLAAYEGLNLADWLARAVEGITLARYLAARPVVRELEKTWRQQRGELPEATWADFHTAPERVAQYQETLRAWERWARENPRSSGHFFDADRKRWPKKAVADSSRTPMRSDE